MSEKPTTTMTGSTNDICWRPSETNLELWETFKEWWPSWVEHVECWRNKDDKTIIIFMKEDNYTTSGSIYLFEKGKNGRKALKRIQALVKSVENTVNNEGTRT